MPGSGEISIRWRCRPRCEGCCRGWIPRFRRAKARGRCRLRCVWERCRPMCRTGICGGRLSRHRRQGSRWSGFRGAWCRRWCRSRQPGCGLLSHTAARWSLCGIRLWWGRSGLCGNARARWRCSKGLRTRRWRRRRPLSLRCRARTNLWCGCRVRHGFQP